MSVNMKGTWIMTRAIAPLLRAAGAGAIVNVSSATVIERFAAVVALRFFERRDHRHDAGNCAANSVTTTSPLMSIAPGLTLTGASLGLMDNAGGIRCDAGAR